MTRVFREGGQSVPVTALEIGPCYIIQIKREEKEGYNAIQLGYQPKREKKLNKPLLGHYKAAGKGGFRHLREIRVDDADSFELGQEITLEMFNVGDSVTVRGLSKGRGFAGVVKRWGFSGGGATHAPRGVERRRRVKSRLSWGWPCPSKMSPSRTTRSGRCAWTWATRSTSQRSPSNEPRCR